ncbi:MAG: nicotinate (nicotinamide) nucleotide adenylyltransferase [Calditrichaeota bacterium]|nr:nicotinate (nicotinamide) nucleotide adenylyltransferase [Calditrichota bacterium]MCB9391560.1 nicotinate (nicotinamide) nucleotide adenylyltransferase [Calditrichota bacterium]
MSRLGLFGGTFDPVHYGHLRTVEAARLELELPAVWILPNPHPPHKLHVPLTDYNHRKEMLKLALQEYPNLVLSDTEEKVKGPAYTTETIERVLADLPPGEHELWLIVGADSLIELPRWKNPEDLFKHARVAVLRRPGVNLDDARREYLSRVKLLETPLLPVSATEIRRAIQDGKDTSEWLPDSVRNYIAAHGLYQTG